MTKPLPSIDSQPSIYDFIRSGLDLDGRLHNDGEVLPDEAKAVTRGGLRWVAGGMDGAMGHRAGPGDVETRTAKTTDLFIAALARPTTRRLRMLYPAISGDDALQYIDPLIERLVGRNPDISKLHRPALWLAGGTRSLLESALKATGRAGDWSVIERGGTIQG